MSEANAPLPPSPLTPEQVVAWLDYELSPLLARRAEVIEQLNDIIAKHPMVEDDETQGICAESLRLATTLTAASEARRQEQKKPFLEAGRAVDSWQKRYLVPLETAAKPVSTVMLAYADRKEREARARAAAEAKAAREAAAEAERKAEEQRKAALFSDEAEKAEEEAQKALAAARQAEQQAQGRPADFTRARGDYGAVASVRQTWGWEVEDAAKVPRRFMTIDPAKIREAARPRDASGKPTTVIPGIRWVAQRSIGVR
jgi:hypothetical protein